MPKIRCDWTEEQLQAAMTAVEGGWSVYKASKTYSIPRRTLRNHIKKGSRTKNTGHPTYLNATEEKDLCTQITKMCNTGMPLTAKLLRRTVYNYCVLNKIKHPFSEEKGMAGRKWMQLFMKRNPEIAARWSLTQNPAIKMVINHFQKLRDIIQDPDFAENPHTIYNIAEKECKFGLYHNQAPLGEVDMVTIVASGNAVGGTIPPLVIFKGQRIKPEWRDNLPAGTEVCVSVRGTMTTNVFIKWVEHFSKFKSPGKSLLIFDGAPSQLDANIVKTADRHDIILCCLPSDLQPLDRSVFKCFESFWDEEVLNFWEMNAERKMTRVDFSSTFGKVWPLCSTESNVVSGFRETGIFPFDPAAFPSRPNEAKEDEEGSSQLEIEPLVPATGSAIRMEEDDSSCDSELNG